MIAACKTLVLGKHDEANRILSVFGIPADVFIQGSRDGEFSRDNCSDEYHPSSYPGSAAWADTFRSIAVAVKPVGWVKRERNGLSVIESPCGKHAIAIQLGDKGTGDPNATPKTVYPKGSGTLDVVKANGSLVLPGMEDFVRQPKSHHIVKGGCQTWFFLRHRPFVKQPLLSDPTREIRSYADHVFLELSLPITSIDTSSSDEDDEAPYASAKAKVTEWSTRIIFGKMPLSPNPMGADVPGPVGPADSNAGLFHIEISRK